jgi:hypothetical protein
MTDRHWLTRYKWCPDKTCRPVGKVKMYGNVDEVGTCMGQLKYASDHVFTGVNDMCLCIKQTKKVDRWHFNFNDILAAMVMLCGVLEARQQALPAWLLYRLNHIKMRQQLPQ